MSDRLDYCAACWKLLWPTGRMAVGSYWCPAIAP
jgi:hypothetical protein